MKRFKIAPPPYIPKFAVGQRVRPTPQAQELGWKQHGEVTFPGQHAIRVRVDGGEESGFHPDYWEAE